VSEKIQVRSNSPPYTFDWFISHAEFSLSYWRQGEGRKIDRVFCMFFDNWRAILISSCAPVSPFGNVDFLVTATTFSSLRQLFRRIERTLNQLSQAPKGLAANVKVANLHDLTGL
jgi:hypothetical protein